MTTDEEHNCRDDKLTISNIEKFGLSVIIIEATDYLPSFAYSIGLWQKFKHPEIICFGLRNETLQSIINNVADIVKSGRTIEENRIYNDIFESSRAEFLKVDERN